MIRNGRIHYDEQKPSHGQAIATQAKPVWTPGAKRGRTALDGSMEGWNFPPFGMRSVKKNYPSIYTPLHSIGQPPVLLSRRSQWGASEPASRWGERTVRNCGGDVRLTLSFLDTLIFVLLLGSCTDHSMWIDAHLILT